MKPVPDYSDTFVQRTGDREPQVFEDAMTLPS